MPTRVKPQEAHSAHFNVSRSGFREAHFPKHSKEREIGSRFLRLSSIRLREDTRSHVCAEPSVMCVLVLWLKYVNLT